MLTPNSSSPNFSSTSNRRSARTRRLGENSRWSTRSGSPSMQPAYVMGRKNCWSRLRSPERTGVERAMRYSRRLTTGSNGSCRGNIRGNGSISRSMAGRKKWRGLSSLPIPTRMFWLSTGRLGSGRRGSLCRPHSSCRPVIRNGQCTRQMSMQT